MRVIVVGASGAGGGRAVVNALGDRHEVIAVGRSSGDILADVNDPESIRAMYEQAGRVGGVISAVGHGHFGPVQGMTEEQFMKGIYHKVLPQINLVLEGLAYLEDGGSFTLTSGILNRDPIKGGAAGAAANGAIDSFVLGAAVDMPRNIRINTVSATVLDVSAEKYDGFFPGHRPVSSVHVGLAYCKSLEGVITGQVIIVE